MNWYQKEIEHHTKVVKAFRAATTSENMKAVREANDYLNAERCEKCGLRINVNGYSECNCK